MKTSVLFFVVILSIGLLTPRNSDAKEIAIGLFAGGNYSTYNWPTPIFSAALTSSSLGGAGGLSASFFQNHLFGFRLALQAVSINQAYVATSQIYSAAGTAPFASLAIDINFDYGSNRHSIGIGAGGQSFAGFTFTGGGQLGIPTSAVGVVLEGKDFWKNGWFDYAVAFFGRDNTGLVNRLSMLTLGVGYDFGAKN